MPGCACPTTLRRSPQLPRTSILDVARGLTPLLLGVSLVLPALRVTLLVRGAAFLLGMSRTLPGILADVTCLATLLRLLRRPGYSWQGSQKHRNCQGVNARDSFKHDATSI